MEFIDRVLCLLFYVNCCGIFFVWLSLGFYGYFLVEFLGMNVFAKLNEHVLNWNCIFN